MFHNDTNHLVICVIVLMYCQAGLKADLRRNWFQAAVEGRKHVFSLPLKADMNMVFLPFVLDLQICSYSSRRRSERRRAFISNLFSAPSSLSFTLSLALSHRSALLSLSLFSLFSLIQLSTMHVCVCVCVCVEFMCGFL